jgi:hypothetical protein
LLWCLTLACMLHVNFVVVSDRGGVTFKGEGSMALQKISKPLKKIIF